MMIRAVPAEPKACRDITGSECVKRSEKVPQLPKRGRNRLADLLLERVGIGAKSRDANALVREARRES